MVQTEHRTRATGADEPRPQAPVRRFDVFAEYKRLEAERRGDAPDDAAGYGIWVAKVVAGRRFGRSRAAGDRRSAQPPERGRRHAARDERDGEPHELDGEPQTAAVFRREIVERMGQRFYERVFAPAIRAAFEAGERYEAIRDRIRRAWQP
jgi:hypothetical protein